MAIKIIDTTFAAGDELLTTIERYKTIAEAWLGEGATTSISNWGDFYDLINPVLEEFGQSPLTDLYDWELETAAMNFLNQPEDVLASAALAWWSADRSDLITLASGTAISSWRDIYHAYAAIQGTPSAQPDYLATGFGGGPAVDPGGLNKYLSMDSNLAWLPTGSGPVNIFGVAQQDQDTSSSGARVLVTYGETSNANRIRTLYRQGVSSVNRALANIGTGSSVTTLSGTAVDLSGRHVMHLDVGATNSTLNTDGIEDATATVTPDTGNTRLRFFAGLAVASAFWKGPVRDIFFGKGDMTADQKTYVTNFFKSRRAL